MRVSISETVPSVLLATQMIGAGTIRTVAKSKPAIGVVTTRRSATDKAVPGEPSDEHCAGCSMLYKWNPDGSLKSYTTFPAGDGASSYRFICDVADKF